MEARGEGTEGNKGQCFNAPPFEQRCVPETISQPLAPAAILLSLHIATRFKSGDLVQKTFRKILAFGFDVFSFNISAYVAVL